MAAHSASAGGLSSLTVGPQHFDTHETPIGRAVDDQGFVPVTFAGDWFESGACELYVDGVLVGTSSGALQTNLLAGVEGGRYDVLINSVGVTEERKLKYDFSDPYAFNRPVIIVRGEYDEIHSFDDLKGKRTANTITSTFAEVAEQYGAKVTGVDDLNQTIELVLSGRFDATLNTEVTFMDYMKAHPNANLKIAAYGPDATWIAIPVRKGEESASFLNAVNEAIADMAEKGILSELSIKYFGSDITKLD